jgi:hypothetical protein
LAPKSALHDSNRVGSLMTMMMFVVADATIRRRKRRKASLDRSK